jgi:hypothetical protein
LQFSAFCGLLVLPVREPHEFRGVLERSGQGSARVCPSGEHRMSWEVSAMAVRTSIGLIFESRFSKWFGVSVVQRGWSSDLLTGVTIGLIAALVTP